MVDLTAVRFLVAAVTGWLYQEHAEVVAYLVEENRTLRAQLRGRRLLLTDDQRRRLAVRGQRPRARTAARGRDDRDTRHDSAVASASSNDALDCANRELASSNDALDCSNREVA